jgi:hypothetical protein
MKSNVYDLATDEIKLRLAGVNSLLHETFKGTKPYRKELVPPKERYYEYMSKSEEEKQFARQQFPQEMAIYEQEMMKIGKRYQGVQ